MLGTPCLVGTLQATRGRFVKRPACKPRQDWGIRYIRGVMGRIRGCGTLPEKQLKVYKAPHRFGVLGKGATVDFSEIPCPTHRLDVLKSPVKQ